ncbi:MAG: MOSC domain-containing protein [Hyphomicrobium sp.]
MSDSTHPCVQSIYRYPVKALSPERLGRVTLTTGATMPFDRAYAIENGPGRFDAQAPRHLPKVTFLTLMRDERAATLDTTFDDATETLTISRGGKQVARGQLTTKLGRTLIEQFLAAYMKAELRGAPRIVSAPGHSFSDVAAKCLHIVNLASLRELERAAGRPIDPLRFRPNVIVDGMPPWAEFDWVGKDFALGSARVRGLVRTQRCAATNVDPGTGHRDMAIPAILERTWGHTDFGVYASVIADGTVAIGDALD